MTKDVHWPSRKVLVILADFDKTWFFQQICEKYSNTKFHEDPSSGDRVVPYGRRTGRHDEADCRFSQFYESAYKVTDIKMTAKRSLGRVVKLLPMPTAPHRSRPDLLQHIRSIFAGTGPTDRSITWKLSLKCTSITYLYVRHTNDLLGWTPMYVALYKFGLRTLRGVTQRLVDFCTRHLVYANRPRHFISCNKRKKQLMYISRDI
jgi:hypothetical protein